MKFLAGFILGIAVAVGGMAAAGKKPSMDPCLDRPAPAADVAKLRVKPY